MTRKTLLEEPGRLGFLGSVNTSWLLVNTHGKVIGGAAADGASRLTYDLATGQASQKKVDPDGKIRPTARDKLATWTPALIVSLLLAVLMFAAAPILEVLLPVLGQ